MTEEETPKKPKFSKSNILSLVLLIAFLIAIPVFVAIFGERTRTDIKAGIECKRPPIPDPDECVGGEWKITKNTDGCIRFNCVLQ